MAGHVGALELLIQRGAAMVVQEDDGRTPLHWAVLGGHLQVARRLLESGHPVNVADAAQGTPLHAVAVHEQEAMGELLLNAGADVTAQDGWHQTLLHQAAIMGQAPLVRLMLSRRAQIDLADADGTTPLQQAFLMAQAGLRGSGSVLSALLEGSVEDVMATGAPLFAGDSEIDTIFKIFQKLGTPTEVMWPGVSELPDYKATFPRWPTRGWAQIRNTAAQVGQDGIELLEKLISYDPKSRITARRSLQHPYFRDVDKTSIDA
ncbi:unnamed protein product [Polarella glacialis]|uniref:Mitogen-activated protein kinase n=1 Tax=Polarella glacialis TaxID=89957 RepID=A0A813FLS8_POLGL|nr:unnamed protein product [Polarella glacialis]